MKTRFMRYVAAALLAFVVVMSAATRGQHNSPMGPNQSVTARSVTSSNLSSPAVPSAEMTTLLDKIRRHEEVAATLAERLRTAKSDASASDSAMNKKWQRQLTGNLEAAFDGKLQLEELQLNELRKKLAHFEGQIDQRRTLRDKIVARRVSELIDQSDLNWNSTVPTSEVATNSPTVPEEENRSALTTQVKFLGQDGMKILIDGMSDELIIPARYNFYRRANATTRVALTFSNADGIPENTQVYGLLDTYSVGDSPAASFLKHNSVPVQITSEDLELAKNDVVIKFFYLKQEADRSSSLSTKRLLQSQISSDTQTDPDGTVLVALQLTRQLERIGVTAAEKLTTDPTPASGESAEVPPFRRNTRSSETTNSSPIEAKREAPKSAPTPESLRNQFEPLRQQAEMFRNDARQLEADYWRDRSRAGELRQNIGKLNDVLNRWDKLWKELGSDVQQERHKVEMSTTIADAASQRFTEIVKHFATGEINQQMVNQAADERKLSAELASKQKEQMQKLDAAMREWTPQKALNNEYVSHAAPPLPGASDELPGVALLRLEIVTGLKLELVHLDDLQLWFKTALRVRESNAVYRSGDLIVTLNGHLFNSLDEAAANINPPYRTTSLYLVGGLGGTPTAVQDNMQLGGANMLPGSIDNALYNFEAQIPNAETGELTTQYLEGFGVSADGLVVICVGLNKIKLTEPMLVYGAATGKATVVASDPDHGLVLVKVQPERARLFPWVKCRSIMPTRDQQVRSYNTSNLATVSAVNAVLPSPLTGKDGFVIQAFPIDIKVGIALESKDLQLQGIVVAPADSKADAADKSYLAVPAIYVERLIEQYSKSIPQ